MTTEKIEMGMIFKNYYKLCEALDIIPSTNRQQQLKMISRFAKIGKIEGTQQYVVQEVYDTPIPQKQKGRKRKYNPKITKAPKDLLGSHGNDKYIGYEKRILLKNILEQKDGYLLCDRRELMFILGICNEKYVEADYKTENINGYCYGVKFFDYNFVSRMTALMQGMLNSLIKHHLIVIEETVVYYKKYSIEYMVANSDEYETFLKIVNNQLNKYHFVQYKELYYPRQNQITDAKLCLIDIKKELEEVLGWTGYSRKMKISLDTNIDLNDLKELLEFDTQELKQKLNCLIMQLFREYMHKKGQKIYNYNPDINISMVIGTEDQSIKKRAYEEFCSDLEELLDKYIRI